MTIDGINWNVAYPLVDGKIPALRDLTMFVLRGMPGVDEPVDCYLSVPDNNTLSIHLGDDLHVETVNLVPGEHYSEKRTEYLLIRAVTDGGDIPTDSSKYRIEPCNVIWLMDFQLPDILGEDGLRWGFTAGEGWSMETRGNLTRLTIVPEYPDRDAVQKGLYMLNGVTSGNVSIKGSESTRISTTDSGHKISVGRREVVK